MSTGFVAVPVVPTFKGMSKEFADRLVNPAKKAGAQASKAISTSLEGTVRSLESQVQASTRKLQDLDRAYESSRSKQKQRQNELTAATLKLKDAEEAYQKAVASGKSGTAELAKIATAKSKVEAATNNLKNAELDLRAAEKKHEDQLKDLNSTMTKHKKAQDEMANSAKKSKGAFSGMAGHLGEMKAKVSEMGGPLGNAADLLSSFKAGPATGVLAVAGALGTAATAATKFNEDLKKSSVEIQNRMGMSADAARDMQRDVADALGSGMGDYQSTAESVMAIQQTLADNSVHMAGQTAAQLSDNFMAFAQTFEVGMSEAVSTVDIMLNTGLVKSAEDGVDLLTASMQRVPQALQGEVLDAANEYSKFFANLGIEGPEAMGMLVKAAEQGQYAIDKTGDAIKEFSLKAVDPAVAETLSGMGVQVEDLAGRVARGGSEASDAMSEMATAILGIEDDGKRAEAAIAAFGTPLEDLAIDQVPAFLETLASGGSAMEDFAGASQRMADNTTQTMSGMFSSLKGKVQGWAIDMALGVDEAIGGAAENLGGVISGGWTAILDSELISQAKTEILDFASAAGEKLGEFKDRATDLWETIEPYVGQFLDYMGGSFMEIWDSLSNALGDVAGVVMDLVTAIGGTLFDVLQTVWDFISPVLIPVLKLAAGIIGGTLVIAIAGLTEALKLGANIIEFFAGVLGWLVDNAIAPVIRWLGDFIVAVQDNFVPVMVSAADWVGEKWQEWSTILGAVWDWVKAYVIDKATDAIAVMAAWWNEKLEQISDAWNWLKDTVHAGWTWIDQNVFTPMRNGLDTLKGWFQSAVDGITAIWESMRAAIAKPINFVISTVYNGGIRKVWDSVAKLIGQEDKTLPEIPSIAFKSGGITPGPATPGRDIHRYFSPTGGFLELSGYESVMRPEWTEAVGEDYVNTMNAAARRGGVAGVRRLLHEAGAHFATGGILPVQRFAAGGVIDSIVGLVNRFFPGMTITSTFRPGDPGYHGSGNAVDFSDGFDTTPGMQAAARFFHDEYGPGLAELIHWPLAGHQNLKHGQPLNYGEPTNSQHRNHVHVASLAALPAPGNVEEWLSKIGEFAAAGGGGGVTNWLRSKVADVVSKIIDPIKDQIPQGPGWFGGIAAGAFDKIAGGFVDWLRGQSGTGGAGSFDGQGGVSGNVESWREMAMEAMRRNGFDADNPAQVNAMLAQIQSESGGNPGIAQQIVDVNGTGESAGVGLLQIIPGTFAAHRDPTLPDDRRDPWANMNAALRYYRSRYGGDLTTMWGHGHGYKSGGIIEIAKLLGAKLYDVGGVMPHGTLALNASGEDEFVLKNSGMKDLGGILRVIGDLVPAIKKQTNVIADQVDATQNFMVKALDYRSEEGITARQTVRGLLDIGLDLPGSDIVSAVVEGEAAIWDARERAEGHIDNLAAKEEALIEARKALAELEADKGGMSKDDKRKLADAEEKLAEAQADAKKADSEEKRAEATDKVAEAEENLKRVREDLEGSAEESAKKRADELKKANEAVAKAEGDYAEARKAQVMDLDHISLISGRSIAGLIPAAQGLAEKLTSIGVSSGAVSAGLGSVTSALSGAAAAIGPAGITLGMALESGKAILGIGKKIYEWIKNIIEKVRQARIEARKVFADAWSTIAEYASLTVELQTNVLSLQQALVRGLIEQRTAMFNLEVATHDRFVREVEGQLAVAEARLALDDEIEAGALAAQIRLKGLHEDWDSYRTFEAEKAQGVLEEWSDAAISALFKYEAARAQALKGDLEARVEQIKAEAALAEATRTNLRNQEDLLTAQERLIQMSAKVAGVDMVEATGTAQVAKLMAELAEVQAAIDSNTFGRWGYKLGANGQYANEYRGQLAEKKALRASLDAVMAETGVSVDEKKLQRTLRLMAQTAYRDGDTLAVLRANMPELAAAETALKINESLAPVYEVRDKQRGIQREVEDLGAEIDLYSKVTPLEETIKGLDYTIQSLNQASSAWADGNEELRGDYLRASAVNSNAAAALGVNWKLDDRYATDGLRQQLRKEVTIHMDGEKMYTADQVDELLREVTSGTGVSVNIHKSATLVANARRKERI